METDISRKAIDNERVILASKDREQKERFLSEERNHILRLTGKILGRSVTESDDEWSVAFIAASDAIDTYNPQKGDFWSFASVVIKNRLADYLKKENKKRENEISVNPEAFTRDLTDEDTPSAAEISVSKQESKDVVENDLKNEIEAFKEELSSYGITIRDLAEASPKTDKTREDCERSVGSMFEPPELLTKLKKTKGFPIKEVMLRTGVKRKTLDRHRKYLVAAAVVFDGDYPGLKEYFPFKIKGKNIKERKDEESAK